MRAAGGRIGLLLFALVVGISLLEGACGSATPVTQAAATSPVNKTEAPAAPLPVKTAAEDGAYVASGPIIVENQVDVLALRGGVVSQLLVDVGTPVHKGQLLGRLDDRLAAAQRDAADAKLKTCEADLKDWEAETKLAQVDFERAQRMRDAGINTQEELDHARYKLVGSQFEIEKANQELNNARDSLRVAELELQKTQVEAPFDGVIARRYVRAGQTVAPGDRIFWVSAISPLLVKFTLPERFLSHIQAGDLVYVSSVSMPNETHTAKITQLSPVVDPASDSIDVQARLEGKTGGLRPGMTANIRMTAPAASAHEPH
ncbi:MAG TPA: efflux RND transporter periplasmic adaptor subunit [Candidatus Aquilonibacter sp.]|nr:efflux RND transporter periplasmic adaptor subunit [Candidatus Aquilonibacter sp.]